jgi:type I restriction enzyme S subunit
MSKWKMVKLDTLADFKNGLNYSQENFGMGMKVIGVSDFQDYNYPKYKNLSQINPKGIVRDADLLAEGDFLFVRSNGNRELIGRCLYIKNLPEKISHSGFTIRTRFFESNQIENRFYLYFFKSEILKKTLRLYGGGTNINNLNQGILSRLDVPLPPLPIQRKIAAILSAYDELIENNNRRIAILEKMAEEIYREWFVRLRFPGHEKVKVVKGVPEGWEVKKIEDLFQIKRGKVVSSEALIDGEVPVIGGGVSFSCYHNKANTVSPTITISASGANAGYINIYYENVWASDCSFVDTTVTNSIFYVYLLLKSKQNEITYLQKGSAQPHVYAKDVMDLGVLTPDTGLITLFEKIINPIFHEIRALRKSLGLLKSTRDLLLPRLISGKLDVENLDIAFPPGMEEEVK